MHFSVSLDSREDFISFSEKIGQAFKAREREKPWAVVLDGDAISGKSLIALAVDSAFHPEKYPHRIDESRSIHQELDPEENPSRQGRLSVVFGNVASGGKVLPSYSALYKNCQSYLVDKKHFEEFWPGFIKLNDNAKVLIVSNLRCRSAVIERQGSLKGPIVYNKCNYRLEGLNSDYLDMHINVSILPDKRKRTRPDELQRRRLNITVEDRKLVQEMERRGVFDDVEFDSVNYDLYKQATSSLSPCLAL